MKYYVDIFKIVFTLSIAIMITMLVKVELFSFEKIESPRYLVASMKYSNNVFNVPFFKDRVFRNVVSKYVLNNECTNLEYNLQKLDDNRSNLFLNCNNPVNYVFDFENKKVLTMDDIISDKDRFSDNEKHLLYLKYPYFVVDDIISKTYNIKDYEMIGYYKTKEFGDLTLRINNNEINNTMNYEMMYNTSYKNETFKIDKSKKLIAFSYDDGPSEYDYKTVDILKKSHFKATFFVVGNRLEKYKDVLKYLNESNMEVGNHTFNHKVLNSLEDNEAFNEITSVNDEYKRLTNNSFDLFRPSYGISKNEIAKKANYPIILWSIDTLDWDNRNEKKTLGAIVKDPRDGDIVLMHSLYESSVKATEKAVKDLYKRGFIVVSVSDLMNYRDIKIEPGKVYRCANCGRD